MNNLSNIKENIFRFLHKKQHLYIPFFIISVLLFYIKDLPYINLLLTDSLFLIILTIIAFFIFKIKWKYSLYLISVSFIIMMFTVIFNQKLTAQTVSEYTYYLLLVISIRFIISKNNEK